MMKVLAYLLCIQFYSIWMTDAVPLHCSFEGEKYEIGQDFYPSSCNTCTCQSSGGTNCTSIACTFVSCADSVTRPGSCCPVCPLNSQWQLLFSCFKQVSGFPYKV